MSKRNPHLGSNLDDFLKEEGMFESASAAAAKKAFALKLKEKMATLHITKSALAQRLGTSRAALDRVLDASNTSVTLNTLSKTAAAVGYKLKVELVSA
ncbi:MAG TPA: helix-turn-helix domain-containing protein [Opitutaceae bacterium]|nr:helix-turn-helix domain-containing protein [Opitutaceae bacterium]